MNQYVLSLQALLCHSRFGDVQLEMPSGYDHYEFTVMRNVAVCSHFRTVPPVLFIRPRLQNISSSPFWQNNAHRNISRAGPPSRTSFDSTELKYRTAPPRLVNTVRTRLDNFRAFLNSLEVFFICFVFRRQMRWSFPPSLIRSSADVHIRSTPTEQKNYFPSVSLASLPFAKWKSYVGKRKIPIQKSNKSLWKEANPKLNTAVCC
jgi:hypothetical protein